MSSCLKAAKELQLIRGCCSRVGRGRCQRLDALLLLCLSVTSVLSSPSGRIFPGSPACRVVSCCCVGGASRLLFCGDPAAIFVPVVVMLRV